MLKSLWTSTTEDSEGTVHIEVPENSVHGRGSPSVDREELHKQVGLQDRDGMLFWGTEDGVLAYEQHAALLEDMPFMKLYAIEGGRHMANYQRAGEVNPILVDFLKSGG